MTGDLAYDIVNLRPGGGGPFTPHCRVRCSNCTGPAALLEFALASSTPPEHVAKKIRGKGWEFDLRNRRYTRCPECIRLRDASRKGESPGPKQVEVELFGRKVSLPEKVVPPELVPPAPPVREPVVFKPTKQDPIIADAPPIPTSTEMVELIAALKAMASNVGALVTTLDNMFPRLLATMPLSPEPPSPVAAPRKVGAPPGPKSAEHVAKLRQAGKKKSQAYIERVRNGLQEIRRNKSNGREPSVHEYIAGLKKLNIAPYSPGRPWSPAIVQKHLDAMDSR